VQQLTVPMRIGLVLLSFAVQASMTSCGDNNSGGTVTNGSISGKWKQSTNFAAGVPAAIIDFHPDGTFASSDLKGSALDVADVGDITVGTWGIKQTSRVKIVELTTQANGKYYIVGGRLSKNGAILSVKFEIGDPDSGIVTEFRSMRSNDD
jgi:hypothetical protein